MQGTGRPRFQPGVIVWMGGRGKCRRVGEVLSGAWCCYAGVTLVRVC